MPKNILKLSAEYDAFFSKLHAGENLTLFRYGDGERSLMVGEPVHAQEGWVAQDGVSKLGKALQETLKIQAPNVYYGISCPCCDQKAYYWYASRIESKNLTFANLFVNINYRRFKKDFEELTRDAIVIANAKGAGNRIGNLNVLKYYSVGNQCVAHYEDGEVDRLIQQIILEYGDRNDLLYVVSAGPMSEVILCALYKNNPNNCYVDFGSAIDCYIHQKDTRPYTDPHSLYGSRDCWMYDPHTTSFDVSVVLTTFKKPDALEKQLEALMGQTLKPRELFLFQDGISNPYRICFDDAFLQRFDQVKIAECNMGVWERFRFAQQTHHPYICMFDDDTIPGSRWLESCHHHMQQQEGVYGTIGIVMENPALYPYRKFFRVGWGNPNRQVEQVDFVGHSWFFKREHLRYMLDGTEKYQEFKYAAEDMCLSYKCKEKGINTFVPPHPYNNLELWGSLPKYGLNFGRSPAAISLNAANYISMKKAISMYLEDGWQVLCGTRPLYIKQLRCRLKLCYTVNRVKKLIKKVQAKMFNR